MTAINVAGLPLVFGDVLRRRPTGFANELSQADVVNAMGTWRIETDRTDML